jgi:hypothetical protein
LGIIVIGADTHKDSHTFAAASGVTGEVVGDRTVVSRTGFHGDRVSWLPLFIEREIFVSGRGA